ncbi:MAG: hypothetical protein AB7S26_31550 [Sandaracinaceae bacterium]
MISKRLASMQIVAAMGLAACGTPTFTFPARDQTCADPGMAACSTDQTSTEESRTVPVPMTFADTDLTFVVGRVSLPAPTAGSGGRQVAPGFNVDGLDSGPDGSSDPNANCEQFQPDFVSTTDPQHVGVDNALSGLIPTIENLIPTENCPGGVRAGCIDALLASQLEMGSFLLLMEVHGVNDYVNDSSVTVEFFVGALPAGATIETGPDGFAADQTFDTMMSLGTPVPGDIFMGRLRATTPMLPLNIDAGEFALTLTVSNAEVRFTIGANGTTATNGAIGGVITVESIVQAAVMIMPDIEGVVRSTVENVADVTPTAADPAVCESLSVGISFSGVSAIRNP